jgi:hypothetical protein
VAASPYRLGTLDMDFNEYRIHAVLTSVARTGPVA